MKSMSEAENKEGNQFVGKDARVYELGYLLVPSIKEEDLTVHYGNIKELIVSLGGEIIADDIPKMLALAYKMEKVTSNVKHKFNSSYFGWVKFYMSADGVTKLKNRLDLDPNFIRFLIIKTVKENTIASKRFMRDDMGHRNIPKRNRESEPAPEINKEEIDKEIDAMIAA